MDKKQQQLKQMFDLAKNNVPGAILVFLSYVIMQIPTCHAIMYDQLDNEKCEVQKNEPNTDRRDTKSDFDFPSGAKEDHRGTEEKQKS
jgi:hypothetical protein